MLDGRVGDDKVVKDALRENANSVDARQRREASERHSLELDAALGKDVGDTAKGKVHRVVIFQTSSSSSMVFFEFFLDRAA